MATVPSKQEQLNQMAAQLQAMQQQAQQIASALQTLTQAKQAGMTITPKTTVEQAQQYLTSKTISDTPQKQLLTPTDFLTQMTALQKALADISTATPSKVGLSEEEKKLYGEALQQLKDRYQQELANLERKQQEEKQRLVARYAAAGFSEPGILEGPMAGVPGIVTKALQELGEQQARERTQLQQAAAGDITAIQMAQAEAERKAQEAAYEQWAKEQQRKLENILKQAGLLETMYSYLTPQQIKVGDRILERDPFTGTYRDVTPEETWRALQEEEIRKNWGWTVDAEGNVWRVNPSLERTERIGKIATKSSTEDQKIIDQIMSDINSTVDQYKLSPEGFRERFIDILAKKYGEKYRDIIANMVYTLMPDITGRTGLYTEKTIPSEIYADLREDILAKKGGLLGRWKYKEEDIIRAYPEVDPQYIRKLIKALRG